MSSRPKQKRTSRRRRRVEIVPRLNGGPITLGFDRLTEDHLYDVISEMA
jgi:hypothetical protein